jgi:tetratricopeptide (TPR) repeat protein
MKAFLLKLFGLTYSMSEYKSQVASAEWYLLDGKPKFALAISKRLARSNPSDPRTWRIMGQALFALQKKRKALKVAKQALEKGPNDVDSLCLAGRVEIACGEALGSSHYTAAQEYFEKALKVDACNAAVLLGFGNSHAGLHNFRKAIEYYDRALATKPDDPTTLSMILFSKAMALYDLGSRDDGIRLHREIIAANPENVLFRQCLDRMLT